MGDEQDAGAWRQGAAVLSNSWGGGASAASARDLLARTAKKITGQTNWTVELGWGRLDVAKAVAAAKAAGTSKPANGKGKKKAGKKRKHG